MAEVTISGQFDLSVNATTTTVAAGTKSTVNSVGSNQYGQSQITFGVSEDLGDGNTAYGNLVFIPSPASNATSLNQDTGSGVGIKGAFGNLFMGNVYSQVWTVYAAADASGFRRNKHSWFSLGKHKRCWRQIPVCRVHIAFNSPRFGHHR